MAGDGRPRVLIVASGTDGGIGRFERLLGAALTELEAAGSFSVDWLMRREHPRYLITDDGERSAASRPKTSSVARFSADVARAIVTRRPDLVVFGHPNLAQLAGVAVLLRIPHVVLAYGLEVMDPLPAAKRWPLTRADLTIAISEFTAGELERKQGVPRANIAVIPLALEPSWLTGVEAVTPQQHDRPRLLSVSRLDVTARDKGIEHVIRALPQVAKLHPAVEYRIVGEGNDTPRLAEIAATAGVGDRVTFTGALPHDALLQEYADADVFVLPAESEGFGLVFLEAMSFGKPVIARAAAAAPEVVAEGDTGHLIRTEAEIAPMINELLADPALARNMGAAGRQRAHETFSYERFVERIDRAIGTALGSAGRIDVSR